MMGLFLLMLPLASLPVLFHFFMRTQAEKRVVTTFLFFNALDPQMKSRKKLKERMLLAMRVLFILLMILALARIPFGQIPLLSGTQTTVIILDNSASMAMDGAEGETMLDDARRRIDRLLAAMDDNAKIAVVLTCHDPAFRQLASLTSDHRKLKEQLSSIAGTHAGSGVEKAIARTKQLLAEAGGGGSIHIFSDLQQSDWGQRALGGGHGRSSCGRSPPAHSRRPRRKRQYQSHQNPDGKHPARPPLPAPTPTPTAQPR